MPLARAQSRLRSVSSKAPRASLPRSDREGRIIAAALKALERDPQATLNDIAAEAGVTRQLVSLYFPGGGTGPVVIEFVRSAIPLFQDLFTNLEMTGSLLSIDDESKLRVIVSDGVDQYLSGIVDLAPAWLFGTGRNIGGADISGEVEGLHDVITSRVFDGDNAWHDNEVAKVSYRAVLSGTELLAFKYRSGTISREVCAKAMTEMFVSFRFHTLPALV